MDLFELLRALNFEPSIFQTPDPDPRIKQLELERGEEQQRAFPSLSVSLIMH